MDRLISSPFTCLKPSVWPGGFLYRRDSVTDEVGGVFCGYLTDEVWHHRTDGG